jgi:hypothetical protein
LPLLKLTEQHKGNEAEQQRGPGAGITGDHRGFDPISDALPFGRLWYREPNAIANAIRYAKFFSRSHDAVIRVYDEAGNGIKTHEHTGDFKEPRVFSSHHVGLPAK